MAVVEFAELLAMRRRGRCLQPTLQFEILTVCRCGVNDPDLSISSWRQQSRYIAAQIIARIENDDDDPCPNHL